MPPLFKCFRNKSSTNARRRTFARGILLSLDEASLSRSRNHVIAREIVLLSRSFRSRNHIERSQVIVSWLQQKESPCKVSLSSLDFIKPSPRFRSLSKDQAAIHISLSRVTSCNVARHRQSFHSSVSHATSSAHMRN